jgi:hypothetical protein
MSKEIKEKEQAKEQTEQIEKQLYRLGLWLDTYDDIFSDFDPRPYLKRQISDDFIYEIKKRIRETPKGFFEIAFYLEKEKRNPKIESIIKKRIREYFERELKIITEKNIKKQERWAKYFLFGVIVLVISTIAGIEVNDRAIIIISNLLLPLGWFSIWNSLDYFLNIKPKEFEELEFYKKLKKCEFSFYDIENIKEQFEEKKEKSIIIDSSQTPLQSLQAPQKN